MPHDNTSSSVAADAGSEPSTRSAAAAAAAAGAAMATPTAELSLTLPDGRSLAYALYGPPLKDAAAVIIYHHGVPSSLVEVEPLAAGAASLRVAVVAFDRPGMGGSSPHAAMSAASVADDTAALMDALGLQTAVHAGESGGAPYAAVFAARHPARTQHLLLLAGLAATCGRAHSQLRRHLSGMDRFAINWLGRMGGSRLINHCIKLAAFHMPGAVKRGAGASLGPCDASYLEENDAAKDWLVRFMQRAYQQGVRGAIADYRALGDPWWAGLRGAITCGTHVWHGAGDRVVPVAHAHWWRDAVRDAEMHVMEGEGHISLVGRHAPAILQHLLDSLAASPEEEPQA